MSANDGVAAVMLLLFVVADELARRRAKRLTCNSMGSIGTKRLMNAASHTSV